MVLVALLLLLLRCALAMGFHCSPPALVQALAGRPAQHGDGGSAFVSRPAGLKPHEHAERAWRLPRSGRPSILLARRGMPSTRRITPSSPRVLRASPSSSSSQDQGLQQQQQQQHPSQQMDDPLRLLPQASGNDNRSTLGIDRRVLRRTIVPRLAGAIIKESPLDFAVVEIPQQPAARFTPADPEEPVPKAARKPIVHRIPSADTVVAATEEWRARWGTGVAFQGSAEPPSDELEQMPWNLGKGFDIVAEHLGAPATAQFQDWFLQVATRVAFEATEEEGGGGNDGMMLPPPQAARQIYLQCPEALDKAGRTAVHGAFRNHMAYFSTTAIMPHERRGGGDGKLDAPPVPPDGRVYLEVSFEKRMSRASWPKGRGEYLEFSVYKAGRSTSEVAETICQRLYIKRARLSYAGAKDRRAVTAQKMRCWRLPAESIHGAQAKGRLAEYGIRVSDYRYADAELSLGSLKGNHFEVVLRPPPGGWGSGEAAAVAAAAAAADGGGAVSAAEAFRLLRDEGFVNFFGEQRFGRDGTTNPDVGLLLLGGEWGEAIDRIMAPHPADSVKMADAKELFFCGESYSAAISLLPRTAFVERKLLQALQEVRSDPLRALLELPRELSLLFIQAYQSLLWNQAASRRMGGEFDTRMAVEGDLVLMKGDKPLTAWDTRPEDEKKSSPPPQTSPFSPPVDTDNVNGGGRGGGRDGGRGQGGGRAGEERKGGGARKQEEGPRQEAVRVTDEAARAGIFSIKHVVLPLPGHSVKYPLHSVGEDMLASLKRDGVDDVVLEGHPMDAFDLRGAYRHVVVHPRDFGVQPVPPGAEEEEEAGPATGDDVTAAAAVDDDEKRAARIGADRGPKGGMPAPTTAAWLRARFRGEVKQRFRGNSSSTSSKVGGGAGAETAAGSLTAIRVSFSLPLGAYATTLLQHFTAEGLDGLGKAWHTAGAGGQEGGDFYEGNVEGDVEESGEDEISLDGRGDTLK